MAYVLGLLFADGSLLDTNDSSRTYYLNLTSKDHSLITKVRRCMGSSHVVYTSKPRWHKFRTKTYLCSRVYILRIGNKVIHQDLIKLGLTSRKSLTMEMPVVPDKYFPYFLRGYCDGDGCICISHPTGRTRSSISVVYVSGSFKFLRVLDMCLQEFLGTTLHCIHEQEGTYYLSYKGGTALKVLLYMYRDIRKAPYLKRKYDKYLEVLGYFGKSFS